MSKTAFLTFILVLLCLCGTCYGVEHGPSHNRVFVKEGSDAVLRCSSGNQDLNYEVFDWRKEVPNDRQEVFMYDRGDHYNNGRGGQDPQFKGRISHFEDELQHGNASIKIHNTKMEDSGDYTCYFPRLLPHQTFYVQLVVDGILKDRSGSPGASKPYVKTVNATNDWTLLQCDVRGASPKPKVEWKNSDGKVLHSEEPLVIQSEGRFDVTLLITVNQTGLYRCVVTQEELHHQTDEETFVYISGGKKCAAENPWPGWLIAGFVGLVLGVFGSAAGQRLWPVVRKHYTDEKLWTCRTFTCQSASPSSETSLEREEPCQHELMSEKLPPS